MCSASSPPRNSFAANVGMSRCLGRDTSQRAFLAASMGIPLSLRVSSRRMSLPFTQFPAHLGGPFRYSFDTKTHSRQGISPSARRLIAGLLLTQSPAPWRPLRRAAPPSSTRNPRPRRCAASPSSTRCPTLASSSFISRGPRALSFSYLSTLLPSDRSLSGFLHSPFVAGFFRAFMRVCTPTNTRKQEKRSSPSVGAI